MAAAPPTPPEPWDDTQAPSDRSSGGEPEAVEGGRALLERALEHPDEEGPVTWGPARGPGFRAAVWVILGAIALGCAAALAELATRLAGG